jgi:hypothetical protein
LAELALQLIKFDFAAFEKLGTGLRVLALSHLLDLLGVSGGVPLGTFVGG